MLTDITFCVNEPADRSYEPKPDPTYIKGETVWMYLEGFKFRYKEEDYLYVISFDSRMELYDEQGNLIREGTQRMDMPSSKKPVYIWFTFWIDTSVLEEGVYTVRITITDRLSGRSATSEGIFSVVKVE